MLLGHIMADGNKLLILHLFDGNFMLRIHFLCFQGGQMDAAAGNGGLAGAMDDIAAEGADVEFGPQYVAASVLVDDLLPVHQLREADPQAPGQRLHQGDIRQPSAGLPFGNGLVADADHLRQLGLGQLSFLPEMLDGRAGDVGIHRIPFFRMPQAYQNEGNSATYAG